LSSPELQSASAEVDQTISAERESIEREIVKARVRLTLGIAVTSSVVWLVFGEVNFARGTIWGWTATAYALVVWAIARRLKECHPLAPITAVLDLALASMGFVAAVKSGGKASAFAWTVIPTLTAGLSVNLLRFSEKLSVIATAVAIAFFLLAGVLVGEMRVQAVTVVTCLLAIGFIGVMSARRARLMVARAARLQLLQRYLPESARSRVIEENPDAALGLGDHESELTLLATDLRGFTAMSEKLGPSEVVRQLNDYHSAMLEVADAHEGELDKFIGDGQLFVFGRRAGAEGAGAIAAVACARAMLAALGNHNAARAAAGLLPLKIGIGVHTGRVVSGNIGVRARRVEFTVIGDAVNTASRLESATKDLGVPALISSTTVERLPDRAGLTEAAALTLKGRETPVRAYFFS
jgi:adenylate cyclase